MFKKLVIFLFLFLNLFSKERDPDVKKYSEALGHIIGKHLEELDVEVDIKQVLKGIKDSSKKTAKMKKDKVLIGMKKNEKRIVYIHPSLAFGKTFPSLNSLIIFEIEVIENDSSNINFSPHE